jgi:hypothetical protein
MGMGMCGGLLVMGPKESSFSVFLKQQPSASPLPGSTYVVFTHGGFQTPRFLTLHVLLSWVQNGGGHYYEVNLLASEPSEQPRQTIRTTTHIAYSLLRKQQRDKINGQLRSQILLIFTLLP